MSGLNERYLEHWGVKGMKWGVRRGSSSSGSVKSLHKESSADHTEFAKLKKKKPHEMSNAEMQKVVTRMNLEQQYARLNPSTQQKGQKFALELVGKVGNQAVTAIANKGIKLLVDAAFDAVVPGGKKDK